MARKCQEKNERRVEKWSTIFSPCIERRFANEDFAHSGEKFARQFMHVEAACCSPNCIAIPSSRFFIGTSREGSRSLRIGFDQDRARTPRRFGIPIYNSLKTPMNTGDRQ
jgi:hypothetical protein